jgi:DNA processing protein
MQTARKEMKMTDRAFWLGFHLIPNIGAARLTKLTDAFGDLASAWNAGRDELIEAGLNTRAADELVARRNTIDLDREWANVERAGVQVLTLADDAYPRLLREIDHPPIVIYVKGTLEPDDETSIGVVGTRRATRYGRDMTHRLSTGLATAGVTVISGLARGIDGIAHTASLDAGGRTLAVLGSGVDQIYPPEHRKLSERIVEHGALISEFPLGTRPEARNFPIRNRLISGLSLGVLVIEAPRKSGALITSSFAADQGRTVFAVPGSALSPASEGTLQLLRDGAALAADVSDILDELNLERRQAAIENRRMLPEATEEERRVLSLLEGEPRHIDEIAIDTGLNISQLSALLLQMQLKGLVRDTGGQHYVRD